MSELYIDLRNDAARVLLVEKGAVLYARSLARQVADEEALRQLVAVVRTDSGARFNRAHLLVPDSEVALSQHQTQAQALADARLIVGRALTLESGEPDPLFLLTRMAAEHSQQVYLAEQLPRRIMAKYLQMFRAAGLRLMTVSTSCQAQQAFLAELPGEVHQIQLLLDLGADGVIEAIFFSNTEILQHEVLALAGGVEEQAADQGDAERGERRKLYETMNNLHIIYSRFMNRHPQASLSKLWLAGTGAGVTGLPAALGEALGAEGALLVPAEVRELPEGQIYTALVGCVRQLQKRQPVNFLPPELTKRFNVNTRLVALLVGGLCSLILLAGVGMNERRFGALKGELADEQRALQALQSSSAASLEQLKDLRKIGEVSRNLPPIYGIFRELTLLLPSGVYLEGVDYSVPSGKSTGEIKLNTVIVYDTEFGSRRLLSKYVSALESSELLARHDEPVITYRTAGDRKLMAVAITCTVAARKRGG